MSDHPDLNVVLRGGPFDGRRMRVGNRVPVTLELEGEGFVYRPTAELDDEYPTLTIWVLDRIEAA
jgi:hypothetical protein